MPRNLQICEQVCALTKLEKERHIACRWYVATFNGGQIDEDARNKFQPCDPPECCPYKVEHLVIPYEKEPQVG